MIVMVNLNKIIGKLYHHNVTKLQWRNDNPLPWDLLHYGEDASFPPYHIFAHDNVIMTNDKESPPYDNGTIKNNYTMKQF
jgi:hypothetical protein